MPTCIPFGYYRILILILLMSRSVFSKASNSSSKMLEEIANRSQMKIYKMEGTFNDEEMRIIWNSLGLYISRNLRMGRGINIPKFGIFTFTPPEVRLKGVTNQLQRDRQPRTPVFLIQKDFVKGLNLRTAIFYQQEFGNGLRPYSALGATGQVPITKMNLVEIASYANMSKDATELAMSRIIKYIHDKLYAGQSISFEIPNLGQMVSRNNLVAVKFNEYINRDTRNVLAKSVDERRHRGNTSLTTDNLRKFANLSELSNKLSHKSQQFFEIDDKAKKFLSQNFDLHIDETNLKRSVTNFDRTVATKIFDRTNKSLKDSQLWKKTKSDLLNSKGKSLNREFNMALKVIRQWVNQQNKNASQSYNDICNLANKKNKVLNENDLWNACKQISVDITEQQSQQLFRILDHNKDGWITYQDWKSSVHFESNNQKFQELLQYIRQKRYGIAKIISILGFQGIRYVSVFTLKEGLIRLWPSLNEDEALLLSKYISQNKEEIYIQRIIDLLNIKQSSDGAHVEVDSDWQDSFYGRLKRKMEERNIHQEELNNKFIFYDRNQSGFIEQTDFKKVLGQLGISLSLTQLIKCVKFIPFNSQNNLNYEFLIQKLREASGSQKAKLTEQQFTRIIKQAILSTDKLPFSLPISVSKLNSYLQSKYFKQYSQEQLLPFARKIDMNQNDEVSEEDLKSYRELKRDKNHQKLDSVAIDNLIIRLREKSIKKKISFYDIFRKIDKDGSGFITKESWMKNIDEIIVYTTDEKQNVFTFMDKNNIKMIDIKIFLGIMNGNTNIISSQKFDWAEETLQKIKAWHKQSHLTIEDSFKIIDRDGDTYINEKDIHDFLVDKLKYQERQLSIVRIKKLFKIMDYYKHARITFVDWHNMLNQNKNWMKDVKQQIGIILSRSHTSLSDAFTTIAQGDKKLLFNAFEKWIKAHHILSGFMINDQILKFVFSSLDQHKKGYLLENDFIGLFGSYNWKSQQTKQFIDFISLKFHSAQEAYKTMSGYNNSKAIDFERFKQFISEVFGSRFKEGDCKNIWNNIAGEKSNFTLDQFKKAYGDIWKNNSNGIQKQFPQDSWQYQDFNIIKGTTIRSLEHQYRQKQKMEDQCTKFINNVKDMLMSSPKTLEQAFSEVDKQKTGRITNLMFKKAFRNLMIALTSKQIDLLLNYCNFNVTTLIDWKEFIKFLDIKQDKLKIASRIQPKLQHISDLLHYYMISPKDAYRKWNNPKSGYMSFEQFHKMMKDLYCQASQALPQYQQLEDIFNFIDARKDNQLDFQEFTQVFRSCNPPSLLMGTTPAPSTHLVYKKVHDKEENLPIRQKSIPLFRHSLQYEKFVQLIGRSRRYIQQQIEKTNPQKIAFIPFVDVEKIIRQFAVKHGSIVDESMVRNLIAFTMMGQKVDYHLLVSKFKDLSVQITEFPKRNIF